MDKKRKFLACLRDIDVAALSRVLMACLIAFGGYSHYNSGRLDYLIERSAELENQVAYLDKQVEKQGAELKRVEHMQKRVQR